MRRLFLLAIAVTAALPARAEKPDFRLFGSAGNETHLTPAHSGSFLNPGNFLDVQSRSNSLDLNLFGDLAANDKSWKLHFKLRGDNEWGRRTTSRLQISELYWGVSVTPWLDFEAGRKIEKWGTGYAWNPTGVVNPRKNPSDPNDRRGTYCGVDLVRADLFVRDWSISLLAVPEIDWEGQDGNHLMATGWAVRAYRLAWGTDVSFSASGGSGLPNSQGISLARVFGDALELHSELGFFRDTVRFRPVHDGWRSESRRHVEVLVGGQYTFPRSVNLVLEFFHSGNGLSPEEWCTFRGLVDQGLLELSRGDPMPLLESNLQFVPLAMARDYGFARVYHPFHHDKLEAELLVLASLRDGSALVRPGIYWKVRPNWSLYWLQGEFLGGTRTEFGHVQVRRLSDFGLRYYF